MLSLYRRCILFELDEYEIKYIALAKQKILSLTVKGFLLFMKVIAEYV